MSKENIYLAFHDIGMRKGAKFLVEKNTDDQEIQDFKTFQEVLSVINSNPSLIITNYSHQDEKMNGKAFIKEAKKISPDSYFVLITSNFNSDDAEDLGYNECIDITVDDLQERISNVIRNQI